jgi:HEAT repeat protein
MEELVRALEDGSIKATPAELSALLSHLRPSALGPLLRASELTHIRELQPVLRAAVHGIAERNPQAVAALLRDQDPIVLAGAARLAGRLKAAEAAPTLATLMSHSVADVRLAAVEAAVDLKASTAASALQSLLTDPERAVRIAAARGLGKLRYRPAATRFRDVVSGKEIRTADISEKIAFFESYGELAGEAALEMMDKLLNGKGFLGRKEQPEIRACAALALGKIGTEKARQSLQAATSEEDAVVRSAVNRALRGEETPA